MQRIGAVLRLYERHFYCGHIWKVATYRTNTWHPAGEGLSSFHTTNVNKSQLHDAVSFETINERQAERKITKTDANMWQNLAFNNDVHTIKTACPASMVSDGINKGRLQTTNQFVTEEATDVHCKDIVCTVDK